MNINPLNNKMGKLVDTFLDEESYYDKFEDIAQTIGVISDNPDEIKSAMFSVEGDELIFVTEEVENLFYGWQLFSQLKDMEPYATLLKKYPDRKNKVLNVATRMLSGEEVTDENIIELFKGLDDE